MRAFDQVWTTAAPDFTITPLTQVATNGQVMSENLAEGTHDGVLALPTGPVPATGSQFGGKYAGVFEIANGKIVAQRVYLDRMAVAEQLGLLPAPATTTA
jgi:ketosteroid isomerase-like protein